MIDIQKQYTITQKQTKQINYTAIPVSSQCSQPILDSDIVMIWCKEDQKLTWK